MEIPIEDREIIEIFHGTMDILERDAERIRLTSIGSDNLEAEYMYCYERLKKMVDEIKKIVGKKLIDKEMES